MTIRQALNLAVKKLRTNDIKTPHLDAEILLSHILKKTRSYVLAHPEKEIAKIRITNYQSLITKKNKGEPVAYLTGRREFYGLNFKINKNVLIPRPETELMVDEALKLVHTRVNNRISATKKLLPPPKAKNHENPISWSIADVGTGSGCIIISLAKHLLQSELPITNYRLQATDISRQALATARHNAKLHHVYGYIKFFHGNLLAPIIKNISAGRRPAAIAILANLPYLTPAQIKNSPSLRHEPGLALSAGKDGLKYYRRLFKQVSRLHQITGCQPPATILVEIDPSQTEKIIQLAKKLLPAAETQIKKDLRGLNRLVIIKHSRLTVKN